MTTQLMTRAEVAEMFRMQRGATYRIKGLELCIVPVPGTAAIRFDRDKVLALLNKKPKKQAA